MEDNILIRPVVTKQGVISAEEVRQGVVMGKGEGIGLSAIYFLPFLPPKNEP